MIDVSSEFTRVWLYDGARGFGGWQRIPFLQLLTRLLWILTVLEFSWICCSLFFLHQELKISPHSKSKRKQSLPIITAMQGNVKVKQFSFLKRNSESTQHIDQLFILNAQEYDHSAICDVCDFPIVGIRFKCLKFVVCQLTNE
jgi:hypothetical protein